MPKISIRKTRQVFNEATSTWFDNFETRDIAGKRVVVEMPRSEQSPKKLRSCLLGKGAIRSVVEDDEKLAAVIASHADIYCCVARLGWRDEYRCFVSPVSIAGEYQNILRPARPLFSTASRLKLCGTLEGWRDLVAIAQHSTAMTVALCAAFAAPLLTLVERQSFALMLFGPSKIGKSFAQLVAASTLGFCREQDLPNLNATEAGLLALALDFNDHLLPINEAGTAKGPKKGIYDVLHGATYKLADGRDTIRHSTWEASNGAGEKTFRIICLLSSEIPPDGWAGRNGQTRDDGETARLIGVPAQYRQSRTIFDRPPEELRENALAAWEKQQFQRLHQQLQDQRGVAFSEYLDELLSDVGRHRTRVRSLIEKFEDNVVRTEMTQVARDIVSKFGLLYAAGQLAIDMGVLPFGRKVVEYAVKRACMGALQALPVPGEDLRANIAVLKGRLQSASIIDSDKCSAKEKQLIHQADGFCRRSDGGIEFVIRATPFSGWFKDLAQCQSVLAALDENGFLRHSRSKRTDRSIEWAQSQVNWPDKTRPRSVVVFLPKGIKSLG